MEKSSEGEAYCNGHQVVTDGAHAEASAANTHRTMCLNSGYLEDGAYASAPEIDSFVVGYVPIASLTFRLSQETFNDLSLMITELADLPVSQPLANGVMRNPDYQTDNLHPTHSQAVILKKKLRILNWTNKWRPKFTKALVLTRWARQADAVRKVIDIRFWQLGALTAYQSAAQEIGLIKRHLVPVKEPSPDITTSLETLALGRVSWSSGCNYLKPLALPPQQMLDVLQRINILLSIRLSLYEKIPTMFRDFSIASGRVSFFVPDEFEVDLSLADEDPQSQLYFIDFRFAFSPSTEGLPPGALNMELEARANDVLHRDGLSGLFDLLHNFVLTHKLVVLRSQAEKLTRGYWSEHVIVESVRRCLILQYWTKRAGGKNWIEIGITRGREKHTMYTDGVGPIPRLSVRSFRASKEVSGIGVDLRMSKLSLDNILKQVIAQHSSFTFTTIAMDLSKGLLYSSKSLKVKSKSSSSNPLAATLLVQLTASQAAKVVQEPVTGRFVLSPKSRLNDRAESELNRSMTEADASSKLSYLRALISQQEVEKAAKCMAWERAPALKLGREAMQRYFPRATQEIIFFRHPRWRSHWILAFSTSIDGDSWWIVELPRGTAGSDAYVSHHLNKLMLPCAVYKVALQQPGRTMALAFEPTSLAMSQVERSSAGMICQHDDSRCLARLRIQHRVQRCDVGSETYSITIRFTGIAGCSSTQDTALSSKSWVHHIVKLDYQQLESHSGDAVRIAKAHLRQSRSDRKKLASTIPTLAVNDTNNAYAIRLTHKVGETSIPHLTQQLTAFERLQEFVSTIEPYRELKLRRSSLLNFEFRYAGRSSPLKATIHFTADTAVHLSLSAMNPHNRVLDHLNSFLLQNGLVPLVAMLRITLPLLSALDVVEKAHHNHDVHVLARSEQWYEVRYSSPVPRGGFDVRLRHRRGIPFWFMAESSIKGSAPGISEEEWVRALRMVTRGRGTGWRGVHGGIIAEIPCISDLLQKLDSIFKGAEPPSVALGERKRKVDGETLQID